MEDAKGISLKGWNVDRKGGRLRIDQERTFFTPNPKNPGVYNDLKEAVLESKEKGKLNFKPQYFWKHKNVDTSFRENVDKNSMQIGFGSYKGKPFMEIDIDPNNPHKRFFPHAWDVLKGKTNPYDVANRRYWECKPQKGGGKK